MHANETPKPDASTWRELAACHDTDTAVFYPEKNDARGRAAALAICARCTVAGPCLEDALTHGIHTDPGIRGGLTDKQRRQLRAQRRREQQHPGQHQVAS